MIQFDILHRPDSIQGTDYIGMTTSSFFLEFHVSYDKNLKYEMTIRRGLKFCKLWKILTSLVQKLKILGVLITNQFVYLIS